MNGGVNSVNGRLIRAEARGDLPLLGCLAVLVAVLTALAALAPVLAARQEDRALRQRLVTAQQQDALLTVQTTAEDPANMPSENLLPAATPGTPVDTAALLAKGGRQLIAHADPRLAATLTVSRAEAQFDPATLASPAVPQASVVGTSLALAYITDADAHLRITAGRAPRPRPRSTAHSSPPEIALSRATATLLGLHVGERLSLVGTGDPAGAPSSYVLAGIFEPQRTGDDFWNEQASLDQPIEYPKDTDPTKQLISARGLVAADGVDAAMNAEVPTEPALSWQLRVTLGSDAVTQAARIAQPLASWSTRLDSALCAENPMLDQSSCVLDGQLTDPLLLADGLGPLLAAFTAEDAQAHTVASYAIASLLAVALATAVVAVRLLLRRRDVELRLQRARGASGPRLVLLRLAVATPVVAVAGAAGWAVGLILAPDGTSGAPRPLLAAVLAGAAWLLLPLLTWPAVRNDGRLRGDGPSPARRVVLEATVLLLAVAGVAALRTSTPAGSAQDAAGQGDVRLSAVPVVVALAAVLVLLRLYPPVLRWCAGRLRRGRGLLGYVGLARAGGDAPATAMALFVLVLTLGTAVFGGLVSSTVGAGARTGAAWAAGADAVAVQLGNTTPLTTTSGSAAAGSTTAAGPGGGIRTVTEQLRTFNLIGDRNGAGIGGVAVITVDPAALAAADPGSAAVRALRAALSAPARTLSDGTVQLPALGSPDLLATAPGGSLSATVQPYRKPVVHLRFSPTGTLTTAERDDPVLGPLVSLVADGTPLLVTTAAVEQRLPQLSSGHTAVLLFGGGADAAALHAAAARVLGPLAQVTVRTEELAALRGDGLTRGVGVLYTGSTLLAVLFALLAVGLELVLTAPERGRTTSYLRALGLTGRGAAALHLVQLLPLVPVAALGGVVLGLVEPRILGPALDLRAFTGGPGRPALHSDPALTVALGLAAGLLVLAAAVVETLVARTRTPAARMR
ncbi:MULTISPECIES: hypothetical protein [Streptacidiphilus]|uniref:ABC transport system permease protein n=1 Tax=Streptacidiphilus cavernicola TaxID=3342716 RepID=A0ABV6UQV8_9ACTN|nr:hypothetical protein [Streptacidiphilus jeojiense]